GARVIIVPGEISPQDFSHPTLMARMLDEQKPSASLEPAGSTTVAKTIADKPELKLATLADAGGNSLQLAKSANQDARAEITADPKRGAAAEATPPDSTKDATPAQGSEAAAAINAAKSAGQASDEEQAIERAIDQAAALVQAAPVHLEAPSAGDKTPAS